MTKEPTLEDLEAALKWINRHGSFNDLRPESEFWIAKKAITQAIEIKKGDKVVVSKACLKTIYNALITAAQED